VGCLGASGHELLVHEGFLARDRGSWVAAGGCVGVRVHAFGAVRALTAMLKVRERVASWYEGEIVFDAEEPDAGLVFLSTGRRRVHWTAKVVRVLIGFGRAHWRWIIPVAIGIPSAIAVILHWDR
jgi:hypothetical protein